MKFIRIGISPELFVQLFKKDTSHHIKIIEGLPADAQVLDVRYLQRQRMYDLLYGSETEGVEIGEAGSLDSVPLKPVQILSLDCGNVKEAQDGI